jgi:hypothetical protein
MTTIGAFAPVTWTSESGGEDVVMFIIGDTPQEIDDHDRIIYERLGDTEDIQDILVLEVTHKQWWDIKHGTNILGYYINNTQEIEPIKETQ